MRRMFGVDDRLTRSIGLLLLLLLLLLIFGLVVVSSASSSTFSSSVASVLASSSSCSSSSSTSSWLDFKAKQKTHLILHRSQQIIHLARDGLTE